MEQIFLWELEHIPLPCVINCEVWDFVFFIAEFPMLPGRVVHNRNPNTQGTKAEG